MILTEMRLSINVSLIIQLYGCNAERKLNMAGIYNVATLPELRKQGIGTALTVAPLLDARAWGYQIGTLQSTQMGLHLYRRLGFQEYCTFNAYFWSGEPQETK
jgi:predicted acetyltransferase